MVCDSGAVAPAVVAEAAACPFEKPRVRAPVKHRAAATRAERRRKTRVREEIVMVSM